MHNTPKIPSQYQMWIIVSVKKILEDIFQVCIFVSVKGCISVSDKLVSRGRWSVGGATFEVTITPAYAEARYWYILNISWIFYDAIFGAKITHSAPEDRRSKNKCVHTYIGRVKLKFWGWKVPLRSTLRDLRMNVAPDQTINIGLQIFLDHR